MKFPNLHIVWTAGKNLALPDTLSRNTPPELLTRKTTVEIPKNIKFYLAENETSLTPTRMQICSKKLTLNNHR